VALTDDRGTMSGPYEKQPPQDLAAEQSVLGGMMLSKDAIADVVEVLTPNDFYRPAHQAVYDCVLDLYGRGEPADPITVSAELERRGELGRVGGAPYLHTLIATVPTAANAGYYAEIVAEKAVLRRLVEAGTRIVQMGYNGAEGAEIDEVVDRAQAAIYEVTERRMSEDYVSLEELLQPTMDEIDAIASRGGSALGVPTGFTDLDEMTNGLHPGQMIIVAARPGVGKALALDTPLPTPHGWTTMAEVAVGDELLSADGRPTRVVATTDVLTDRPCFEIEFADGSMIIADADHQWRTETDVCTTAELTSRPHAAVANTRPLTLPERDLPLPPYTLGVLLGRPTDDPEISCLLADDGPTPLPPAYLRASETQRRALLAGLLDTGGEITPTGSIQLAAGNPRLADDGYELIVGLGYQCSMTGRILTFGTTDEVFRLERKRLLHKETACATPMARSIVDVRPTPSVPVRCVEVAAADHQYLAGRSMIPTHNSTLGLDFARSCSVKHSMTSVIFSLEMSRTEIVMRMLSAEAKIRLQDMRGGRMSDDDWTRLARRMSEISEAPLYIDDSPNLTMMEIRAKARRLKQRNDLRLVIVDYLQLMTSGKRVESRQQEVSEFSRNLKLLAKELEVPVVAISQLNRGPEQRTDKRPMLSDLRESGCLTRETRLLRADTGASVTFGALLDHGHNDVLVWSLDDQRRLVPAPVTNVFPSGVKEVFRMTLASGRTVTASGNHRFLAFNGWLPLEQLAVGGQIAVPRRIPAPIAAGLGWSAHRIGLLAHVIGDGSVVRGQPVHHTSPDEEDLAWLRELGIDDLRSHDKRIPDVFHQANDEEIRTFLRHLWATDGSVTVPTERSSAKTEPRIYYSTSSRALAEGVAQLLARLSIATRRYQVSHAKSERPGWHVVVAGSTAMAKFRREVGVHGKRGEAAREYLDRPPVMANTDVDVLPLEVWDLVKSERRRAGLTERQFQAAIGTHYGGSALYEARPSRERLMRCADALDSDALRQAASDDVFWDSIVSIEPLGPQPVYDATVKGTHNFIADGVIAHNSLEQDADMVVLLNRPDAWERDDPRAGEADLIIAKHRAGPTSTITVAHQLHYSRFIDLAQG
jgi:replicative DNA helicase